MDSTSNNEAEFLSLKREVEELKALISLPAVKATLEGLSKQGEKMEQDQPTGFARQEGPSKIHEGHEENPRVRAESMVRTYGIDRSSSPSYSPNFSSSPTSSPHREGRSRQPSRRHHSRRHAHKRHARKRPTGVRLSHSGGTVVPLSTSIVIELIEYFEGHERSILEDIEDGCESKL